MAFLAPESENQSIEEQLEGPYEVQTVHSVFDTSIQSKAIRSDTSASFEYEANGFNLYCLLMRNNTKFTSSLYSGLQK